MARVLAPCNGYSAEDVRGIVAAGAYAEFSFFFHTHATMVGLTHVDREKHRTTFIPVDETAAAIRAATPARAIVSSDCGVSLLPPPVEGLREYLVLLAAVGFDAGELRAMVAENPARLFRIGRVTSGGSCP